MVNISKPISLVLDHIFKDNEGIYAYRYNIAIMWPKYKYMYIGGIFQVSQPVLWEKYVWLLNEG